MPRRTTKVPALSKLSRPRLFGAVARERLFACLDQARHAQPGICVVGPPGAGKTTLVASWLEARKRGGIWYQVDSGDADLATFFHYLGLAAQPFAKRHQRPLPALTPEYLRDVRGFSRRFFRELFARLPAPTTLVLDNYQEVDADNPFHDLISEAIDEVPFGGHLIVVSRADPPSCYARLRANRAVAMIEWHDLRLTLEEALAIGRRQRGIDDAVLSALYAQCDGWAAGLVLMLAEKSGQVGPANPAATTREAVFEYFAGTLFDRAPAALRKMLLSVAFLPYVRSDWSIELSGDPDAAKMLEMLYRRHFFTQRRTDADGSYQFHALFQDFLKAQVRRLLPENDYADLLQRSAELLRTARDIEAAFDLDCERASWDTAAALLIEEAERMIATGRWKTFAQYASRLPGAQLDAKPWLAYWLGASLTPVDQDRARRQMESAFAAFSRSDDWLGKTLSAAGVLDTIGIEMRDMNRALPWIDTLTELIAVKNAFPSPDTELRVLTAFLTPCAYARPDHPLLAAAVRRILEHIRDSRNDNLRVWAAIGVLGYIYLTGAMDIVEEAISLITPVLDSPRVAPANVAHCFGLIGYCRYMNNDFTRAMQAYHRSRNIATAHGLVEQEHMVATWRGYCEWRMGDMDAVDKTVRELEASPVPASSYSKATFLLLKAEAAVGRGQLSEAIRIGTSALEKAELTGYRLSSVTFRAVLIDWLLRAREVDSAAARLDELEEAIERNACMSCFRPTLWAHRFYLYRLLEDPAKAHRCAGTALEEGRRYGALVYMRWAETAIPHLCAYALEHNLHADYARALVSAYRLRPPSRDTEYWPWCVKLRTLGTFEIIAHDQTTQFARKAPKRLLQLLKAIVAFGGADVPAQQLVDALWSDEEGDAGAHSLQVAITRLRKLLGEPDAIQVQDGRVSLSREICWVDALAFERMLPVGAAWTIDLAERACSLYQEAFLSGDADAGWVVPMRERLRTRYVEQVECIGRHYEETSQWDRAASWYQQGIDADPLMESFHRGVILCYAKTGRRAEALSAYRRLRQMLSVTLGIQPSAESQALYDSLYSG